MTWTIYMHTCPNSKRYVGITHRKPTLRWANGNGYRKQFFYKAIQKYGWENIEHEIICEVETLEEAAKIESDLIAKYNTTDKTHGYNISLTTSSCFGMPKPMHSDKTRLKMSRSAKDRPMETRNLNGLLEHRGQQQKGCTHNFRSDETRNKKIDSISKPVVQYKIVLVPVGVYKSAKEAKDKTGINAYNSLHTGCKSGGFVWKHLGSLSDAEKSEIASLINDDEMISIIENHKDGRYLL